MATNKERIERAEEKLELLQQGFNFLESSITDRMSKVEEAITKLTELVCERKHEAGDQLFNRNKIGNGRDKPMFESKPVKLEFPRFEGGDPTVWHTRAEQYFEFQMTAEPQKVPLASYHLEGEANEWWQWLHRAYKEGNQIVTWDVFVGEIWARFGPTEGEDFDEALSKITQTGSLQDYQRQFERLGNRVHGWTQKALVGTFIGGLDPEIADTIRMFKPQTIKDAIGYARMKDQQRQRKSAVDPAPNHPLLEAPAAMKTEAVVPPKRLTWDEMQRRRARGLCFNCDDRFTPGHRCQAPKIMLLAAEEEDIEGEGRTPEAVARAIGLQP